MIMIIAVINHINHIQPPGHLKVLRADQDLQDVRGGEVPRAMLPHMQEPLDMPIKDIKDNSMTCRNPQTCSRLARTFGLPIKDNSKKSELALGLTSESHLQGPLAPRVSILRPVKDPKRTHSSERHQDVTMWASETPKEGSQAFNLYLTPDRAQSRLSAEQPQFQIMKL